MTKREKRKRRSEAEWLAPALGSTLSLKQPHKFIQYNTLIPVDLSDLRIRFYTESSLVYQPETYRVVPIQFHRNEWTVIIHSSATVIQSSIQ